MDINFHSARGINHIILEIKKAICTHQRKAKCTSAASSMIIWDHHGNSYDMVVEGQKMLKTCWPMTPGENKLIKAILQNLGKCQKPKSFHLK